MTTQNSAPIPSSTRNRNSTRVGARGSILGPLLLLLYVNEIKQAVNCDLFLYADDSCLVYQHNDVSKIEQNPGLSTLTVSPCVTRFHYLSHGFTVAS